RGLLPGLAGHHLTAYLARLPGPAYLTPEMIFLRLARSWVVMPAGRMTALNPSTYSAEYLWPCPSGTPVENGRSAVTCQKVMNGIQNMPLSTSEPGGSRSQSGLLKIRCGLHQTIGSDGCSMYRTRLPS